MERNRPIGIVGSGRMGTGLAQALAMAGYQVLLMDHQPEALDKAASQIQKNLQQRVREGTLGDEQVSPILERITRTTRAESMDEIQLLVEAVSGAAEDKLEVLRRMDEIAPADCIFASNTSTVAVTRLAEATGRPDRVLGTHLLHPVTGSKLIELVRTPRTSDATVKSVAGLARDLGWTPVEVADAPGFVSIRLLLPLINEAARCLSAGTAGRDEIDTIMKVGLGMARGPLSLADSLGIDVCVETLELLHQELGGDHFRPCSLLREMAAEGKLGRRSGRGFYDYHES